MIPTTVHQFWLEEGEKPASMARVKAAAENSGFTYKCWSWQELVEAFGAYSFLTEPNGFPEKRVLQFIENFYSWLLLAESPGVYVMKDAELLWDLKTLHDRASVFIGGKLYGEDPSVIATTEMSDVAMVRGAMLAMYERNKDLLSFASSSLLISLHGLTCLQRIILPCLRYNNIPYAYLETPDSIIRTNVTPVHRETQVKPIAAVSQLVPDEGKQVEAISQPTVVQKVVIDDVDTKPAFWIPDCTKRILIFTNDLMDTDFYQFSPGDCVVHLDEARYLEKLRYSTAASHILFVDAYPRSRMRTPASFNLFRHIVFYDKRTDKEWKQKFVEQVNAAPSLVCCVAQEYKLKYPDIPVKVCGMDLSALSRAGLRGNCEQERKWLQEAGIEVTQRHYTCMFLLLDLDGKRQQKWVSKLPASCMYRYVVHKDEMEAAEDEIAVQKAPDDELGLLQAVKSAMDWNWTYLYIGTTHTYVNVNNLLKLLINRPEESGAAVNTSTQYAYNIQPGFFFLRSQAKARLESYTALLQVSPEAGYSSRFFPLAHMEAQEDTIGSIQH